MMKKILLSLLLATASAASQYNGAHIGVGINQTHLLGDLNKKSRVTQEITVRMGGTHITPEIYMGYGGIVGNSSIYVGASTFFRYNSLECSNEKTIMEFKSKNNFFLRNTAGATVNLGYVIGGFLIAGKAGLASANYNFQYDETNQTIARKHANINGKIFGAEISNMISPHLMVTVQADVTKYSSSNIQGRNLSFKFTPTVYNYGVKLSYLF